MEGMNRTKYGEILKGCKGNTTLCPTTVYDSMLTDPEIYRTILRVPVYSDEDVPIHFDVEFPSPIAAGISKGATFPGSEPPPILGRPQVTFSIHIERLLLFFFKDGGFRSDIPYLNTIIKRNKWNGDSFNHTKSL